MSIDSHALALRRYLIAQLGPIEEDEHSYILWHSATFNGARHRFAFTVDPAIDVAAFALTLPEADIPLPEGFVADALVTGISDTRITVEALTIDVA